MQNIVVDANNMLYRAVGSTDSYAKKRGVTHNIKEGVNLDYIQAFFWMLYQSTEEFHNMDTTIYLVWDKKIDQNSTNWRNDINPMYKAQRDSESETRKAVHKTTKHIKQLASAMGIYTVYPLSSECDDIINYLVNNLEGDSVIVSSDQDFLQCINETVSVYTPHKGKTIDVTNFEEHSKVSLEHFIKWKAIKGDPSDNIKGLNKYGDVRAKKLVENWDEDSKKLSSEDIDTINEALQIMDLNSRPLTSNEIYAVDFQLRKKLNRLEGGKLSEVYDLFAIKPETRLLWQNYFNLLDMACILK